MASDDQQTDRDEQAGRRQPEDFEIHPVPASHVARTAPGPPWFLPAIPAMSRPKDSPS
jgi:hypothetical protein